MSEEEEEGGGGTVSSYLYMHTVAMDIVMSARSSLLMHSSDRCADIIMLVATNQCYSLLWSRAVTTNF
jgi:hypothetical protein